MISFVPSTPVGFALFALILLLGPKRGLWALFIAMPFGATAVLSASGVGNVVLLDFCAVAYVLATFARVSIDDVLAAIWPGQAGFPLLVLGTIVVLGAYFLPQFFSGKTQVYAIARYDGRALIELVPFAPTGAQLAQSARFLLGAFLFWAIATVPWEVQDWGLVVRAIVVASCAHALVSFADWVTFPLGMNALLDPIRTIFQAILVDQQFGSVRRLIGGHTEPASFGIYTIGLYGFWLRNSVSRYRWPGSGVFLFIMAILAFRSTSTATIVNLMVFTTGMCLWHWKYLATRQVWFMALTIAALPLVVAALTALLTYSPTAQVLVETLFLDKATSHSGQERLSWNTQALQNFRDSHGLGLGIGSVRASGWAFAVLGNLGLPGAIVFCWFLIKALWPAKALASADIFLLETASALKCGALAVLLQSALTTPFPNLGLPFFAMCGLAVGMCQAREGLFTVRTPFPSVDHARVQVTK